MEALIIFLCGFWLGSVFAVYRIRKQIYQLAKEKGVILDDEQPKVNKVPLLQVERHGNMLYLFEHNSNTFLCQGLSIEELATKLIEYKNIDFALVHHDNKTIWFVNGKVETSTNES